MEHKELTEKILCYLKSSLKETRYRHTIGVRDTAIVMAESEGADIEKAEIAALLHDMARNIPVSVMNRYIEYFNLPEKYKDNVNLAHGKIAAKLAEAEFNITDRDILDAVCYHTTGRAGMSLLEKIIFLADAIEPGRDYPGLDDIRAKADENLDVGCLESLKRTIEFLNEKGVPIDQDTIEAFDYINKEKVYE